MVKLDGMRLTVPVGDIDKFYKTKGIIGRGDKLSIYPSEIAYVMEYADELIISFSTLDKQSLISILKAGGLSVSE